ncbi:MULTISPECIES: c-type cytochrome [unclassified Beijerinckia]|uniref:c-type cytochrome n=1 Tax=unclassified Beijerinckia TaxID=2638183 RepID=UPI00147B83AD|nr:MULTISPECIES: c-type cytochrome [unclassified Beijerinckia]
MNRAFGLAAILLAASISANTATAQALKERLETCAACHGEDGNSKMEKFPSLAGQPEFFVLNQLVLMRENVRQVEQMMPFVKELKDDEIQALAEHYSKLKPEPSDEAADPALVKQGAELAQRLRCASCHGDGLEGREQMPRLSRQRIDYMFEAMKAFRDNRRSGADTAMTAVIVGTSDHDLLALAHYASTK